MSDFIPDSQFKPDTQQPAPTQGSDFIPDASFKPDESSSSEALGTGAEEAASSGTFGLSRLAETVASKGVPGIEQPLFKNLTPEAQQARLEKHPVAAAVGSIVGLVNPLAPEAKALTYAGEKVAGKVVGEGILKGISRSAVKLAAENALYQAGDENAKLMMNDPNQSVGSAITNIGLATAIGGGLGAAVGTVSPLWKATFGDKAAQMAADFKGRMDEHINNPDMGGKFVEELENFHKNVTSHADEVYGPTGLKAEAINKAMPEMSEKITQAAEDFNNRAIKAREELVKKSVPERYVNKFDSELTKYQDIATKPDSTPSQIFNAQQDFKQAMQGYSKGNFGPFAIPSYHEAYDFLNVTKNLAHDARVSLEDSKVWGKAADVQQDLNKAFKDYLPTLQDFEKKFMTNVGGERVIDPGKAATYLKQIGKSSAEIKQDMLRNFLDKSEKYLNQISETHVGMGSTSPVTSTSTNALRGSLKELTPGAKLADLVVHHSGNIAGKGLGAILGGGLGHALGIPGAGFIGGILGEKVLGPLFSSILPVFAKNIVSGEAHGSGLKSAMNYGMDVIKGQKLSDNATKALFKSGSKILPDSLYPDKKSREDLNKILDKTQTDPQANTNVGGDLGHYMPDHAVALGATTTRVTAFLNSIKPNPQPKTMLDKPRPVNQAAQAQYDRALDIAQQPLIVLDAIKQGTMTSHDVMAIASMYPELYTGLKQKVMNEMVAHVSKDEVVPYDTRLGLSMFLQMPLDSSMTPQSIMAAQPTPQNPPQTSQQPQGKGLAASKGNSMLKGAKTGQTALQASQSMHSSDKA